MYKLWNVLMYIRTNDFFTYVPLCDMIWQDNQEWRDVSCIRGGKNAKLAKDSNCHKNTPYLYTCSLK